MSSSTKAPIHFGPFEVTDQVFYTTPFSYALVNIKPILPGHVLVIPLRSVQRMTDLTPAEVTDLFTTVQKVQRMLSSHYFPSSPSPAPQSKIPNGSFNLAIQDGPESGQTVPHMHCHIIPRTKESSSEGDGIYDRLQGEEGNVGSGFWDAWLEKRPGQRGKFPKIEESERRARSNEEMSREAETYRELMKDVWVCGLEIAR